MLGFYGLCSVCANTSKKLNFHPQKGEGGLGDFFARRISAHKKGSLRISFFLYIIMLFMPIRAK